MQFFKRFGATALVVIIVFTLAAPCFSTPVALEGIDIFTALYNAYLVARGMDVVGSTDDVPWSVSEPASSATWRDLWQQNFDYYASQVDQTITDVDAWVSAYIDQLDAQVRDRLNPSEPPEDPNDNGVIGLQFTAQLTEFFDKFTNLIFKNKYNLTNDGSGFVHSSGSFDSPLSVTSGNFASVPVSSNPAADGVFVGVAIGGYGNIFVSSSSPDVFVSCVLAGSNYMTYAVSLSSFADTYFYYSSTHGSGTVTGVQYQSQVVNGVTVYYTTYLPARIGSPAIPDYNSDSAMFNAFVQGVSTGSTLDLLPEDKYSILPIPVPDTDDADYVPSPLDVPLDVPWTSTMDNPDFSDDADPAAEAIIDAITGEVATNTLTTLEPVTPEPPLASPSPVMPPFLPSEPPPFDFNFSGIWYYVVRWVNSMRSGMGWLMNIWTNLPAAMFYPVFGTAVVVIVLGVWRRFVS